MNMAPDIVMSDIRNDAITNPKTACKVSLLPALSQPPLDFFYLRFSQFCAPALFSSIRPAFAHHVLPVVFHCAAKQMAWIRTGSIITMMTDKETRRNRTIMQLVTHPMCPNWSLFQTHNGIARGMYLSSPSPASVRVSRND